MGVRLGLHSLLGPPGIKILRFPLGWVPVVPPFVVLGLVLPPPLSPGGCLWCLLLLCSDLCSLGAPVSKSAVHTTMNIGDVPMPPIHMGYVGYIG